MKLFELMIDDCLEHCSDEERQKVLQALDSERINDEVLAKVVISARNIHDYAQENAFDLMNLILGY